MLGLGRRVAPFCLKGEKRKGKEDSRHGKMGGRNIDDIWAKLKADHAPKKQQPQEQRVSYAVRAKEAEAKAEAEAGRQQQQPKPAECF